MGAAFVGYLCALLAYLYLAITDPSYNKDGKFTAVAMAFSFLVGLQTANIFLVPVKSGVATIFTSMVHSPHCVKIYTNHRRRHTTLKCWKRIIQTCINRESSPTQPL